MFDLAKDERNGAELQPSRYLRKVRIKSSEIEGVGCNRSVLPEEEKRHDNAQDQRCASKQ
jgi:hypothetical protein